SVSPSDRSSAHKNSVEPLLETKGTLTRAPRFGCAARRRNLGTDLRASPCAATIRGSLGSSHSGATAGLAIWKKRHQTTIPTAATATRIRMVDMPLAAA